MIRNRHSFGSSVFIFISHLWKEDLKSNVCCDDVCMSVLNAWISDYKFREVVRCCELITDQCSCICEQPIWIEIPNINFVRRPTEIQSSHAVIYSDYILWRYVVIWAIAKMSPTWFKWIQQIWDILYYFIISGLNKISNLYVWTTSCGRFL